VHQLRGGQEAGGKAEGNIILTGELAILATVVAVAIPGTAGWAERPIHGGGDYNEFMLSDSGLMGFFYRLLLNGTYAIHQRVVFFPQRGFFLLALEKFFCASK
jgi:hypothetical protein